jgi:hypothetical protein
MKASQMLRAFVEAPGFGEAVDSSPLQAGAHRHCFRICAREPTKECFQIRQFAEPRVCMREINSSKAKRQKRAADAGRQRGPQSGFLTHEGEKALRFLGFPGIEQSEREFASAHARDQAPD